MWINERDSSGFCLSFFPFSFLHFDHFRIFNSFISIVGDRSSICLGFFIISKFYSNETHIMECVLLTEWWRIEPEPSYSVVHQIFFSRSIDPFVVHKVFHSAKKKIDPVNATVGLMSFAELASCKCTAHSVVLCFIRLIFLPII